MDLVEAIDAWIDERIDDVSDDELEQILEIQDAVSASELADLEIVHAYNDDVYALVELVGGSTGQQAFTEDVLRAAFFGDPMPADLYPQSDEAAGHPDPEAQVEAEVEVEVDTQELTGADAEQLADPDSQTDPEPYADDEDVNGDTFLADMARATAFDDEQPVDIGEQIADPSSTPDVDVTPALESQPADVQPVDFREGDALGPSFLPESTSPDPSTSSGGWQRAFVAAFMLGALALFIFGSVQLFGTLGQTDETTNEAQRPQATAPAAPTAVGTAAAAPVAQPDADNEAAIESSDDAPEPDDTSDPAPVEPELRPTPSRIGIRLVTGDIILASFDDADAPADLTLLYNPSGDDDLSPARDVAWLNDTVGVIDTDGNVLVIDPDRSTPRARLIYETGGGLDPAVEIAGVNDNLVIRTSEGDVTLVPANGRVDPDVIQFLWDAEEEELAATDLTVSGSLVPVVFDDGSARVIDTDDDNSVSDLWLESESQLAFNVGASDGEVLLGVGQGAVLRFLHDDELQEPTRIWSAIASDQGEALPAIGYASAADRTALVLSSGLIRLANERGYGRTLWDPAETELRALALAGGESDVVALLESGFVVRIPLASSDFIDSVWDITDETLPAANQIAVERHSPEPDQG